MCEPTTIIMGISAAASLMAQQQAANAQEDANRQQYRNSLQARSDNANQVNLRRSEEATAAGEKIMANNTAMREAQATAIARGGPSGLSVDALLSDISRRGASYNDSVNANLERVNQSLDNQLTNVNRTAASEINSLKAPQQPDYLGAALRIGNAVNDYRKTT